MLVGFLTIGLGIVFLSLTVRTSYGTVYAVEVYISTPSTVIDEVDNALPPGSRLLMMDR